MKPPVCLLLTLCALSACTTTYSTQPGTPHAYRLGRLGEKRAATITLSSGERLRAEHARVEGDTLRWYDASAASSQAAPLHDVREVRFLRRGRGAGQGLRYGVAAGAAVGAVYGAATFEGANSCGWEICTWQARAFGYGVVGAFNGLVYGPLAGFIVGARDRFVFTPAALSAPAR